MMTTALSAHPSPPSLQNRGPHKPSISTPCLLSLASPQASSQELLLHARGLRPLSPPASHPWNPLFNPRKVRRSSVGVRFSQIPAENVDAAMDVLSQVPDKVQGLMFRVESALYTLADAAAATDAVTDQKQSGGWLGGLTDALESILKVLKDGLSTLHVPYAYGFAIILLTIMVKAATFPLTKKQVESTLAMQNLSPKIKAIQQRYAGDQERIQLETARLYKQAGVNPLAGCLPTLATIPVFIGLYRALSNVANEGLLTEGFFWIPSLAGPTTIISRQNGTGISWLFPFIDGHPPLGWSDTLAYLVLPVLLVVSQYISMQLMQTPQMDDPSQKNSQLLLKFLPLMIGYFSLSVPSGLSLYWMTNNILSTGQQVWLRQLGGAKPVVGKDGAGIISAGQALRSSSPAPVVDLKEQRRGERFRQLKSEEVKKKGEQAGVARRAAEVVTSTAATLSSESDEEEESGEQGGEDGLISLVSAKDSLEEMYNKNSNGAPGPGASAPKRSKRSKRRRSV